MFSLWDPLQTSQFKKHDLKFSLIALILNFLRFHMAKGEGQLVQTINTYID